MKEKFLATVLIVISILIFNSCFHEQYEQREISIIPRPLKIEQGEGNFVLNSNTVLVVPKSSEISDVANLFAEMIGVPSGFNLNISDKNNDKNVIIFDLSDNSDLGEEGYEIDINENNVKVTAQKPAGLFYGIQTLLQLLPPEIYSQNSEQHSDIKWTIPCCKITDKPRFPWRGMHLDVSRHFFPAEFIKRYIDLIAMHKMNVFHWHLTDDNGWRIEIKKYPKLTGKSAWRVDREDVPWREVTPPEPGEKATYGGFYTQEGIKEIVQYAADRFITIIPEIEMPGHTSEVFAAYPEFSCQGKKLYVKPGSYWPNVDIFCAGKEKTFKFIEDVLLEVIDLFPSEYVHIGGDEADKTRWKECSLCQQRIKNEGLKDEDELQSYFIKRIEKFLNEYGKKLIGWDEILEGGLAPEATVMSWRGMKGGIEAASQGHDVIMCPTSFCYFDYYQANPDFEPEAIGGFLTLKKVYSFDPVPVELNKVQEKHVLGAQGNVWTEYIPTPEHAEYMALPRMTALAEVVWSQTDARDWKCFQNRLQVQFKRFDFMNVNYSQGSWKVDIQPISNNGSFQVKLESEQLNVPIHFTLDGSDLTPQSKVFKELLTINNSTVIKAGLFVDTELKEYYSEKEIVFHKGIGKNAELAKQPSRKYEAHGAMSLVDGLKGSDNFWDNYWLGFEGNDMIFELDLGKEIQISSITASFYQNTGAWIFMPEKVIFEILDAGRNKVERSVLKPESTMEVKGVVIEDISAKFNNETARYVKVHAKNIAKIPNWHEGAGSKAWIFVDEVIVN